LPEELERRGIRRGGGVGHIIYDRHGASRRTATAWPVGL
jgi:hypothetical protein